MSQWSYKTYRTQIPRKSWGQHCYPIKEDTLFAFLDAYKITEVSYIFFSLRTTKSVLLAASYMGEKIKRHPKYDGVAMGHRAGASEIHIHTVDPTDRTLAESLLKEEGLPKMCKWLQEAQTQEKKRRLKDHNIAFRFLRERLLFDTDVKWKHCL